MSYSLIDISGDASRPEGGHALITLRELKALPISLRFTIRAISDDPGELEDAWSLDEREPISARLTPDGVELQIGPDVVDAPELQPGTPILFTMPDCDLNAEVIWPDLPVTIPGKLPAPIIDASSLRAKKIESQKREAAAAESAKAAAAKPTDTEPSQPPVRIKSKVSIGTAKSVAKPAAASSEVNSLAVEPAIASSGAQANMKAATGHDHAGERSASAMSSRNWLSLVFAIIAVPAVFFLLWPTLPSQLANSDSTSSLARLIPKDWMTQILRVGNQSPTGQDASGITAQQALERAEQAIFSANGENNIEERKFWLRKAITLLLAEPQSRWAVTQLGALKTANGSSKQQPDYRSAKTLWEIASASGDTVATCFLAQLYKLGLGVLKNSDRAQQWLERANKQGGCNLQHERPTPVLTN